MNDYPSPTPINDRQDFINSWLFEMPQCINAIDAYSQLVYDIEEIKETNPAIISLNGLKAIIGNQVRFYWYEDNGTITLGAEIVKFPQGFTVRLVGKNPSHKGNPPYAIDLYENIINHIRPYSLRLASDEKLTQGGYKIWKELLNRGHKVSIYNLEDPGKSYKVFSSTDEMDKFFDQSKDYSKYQFIVSESAIELMETKNHFNIRRYRELSDTL